MWGCRVRVLDAASLGRAVKALRDRRRWAQEQLAEEIGATDTWVADFEAGQVMSRPDWMLAAVSTLGGQLHVFDGKTKLGFDRPVDATIEGPQPQR